MKRVVLALIFLSCALADVASAKDSSLVGLWYSKRNFGPEVRGELRLTRLGDAWTATIGSRSAAARFTRDSVLFDMPGAAKFKGHFISKPMADGRRPMAIMGEWIEPARRIAMPIALEPCGIGCYSAMIQPYDETFTFYMNVFPRANGQLGAFLRNPERNQGRFIGLDHLVRRGDTVLLKNRVDTTIQKGILQEDKLSVYLRFATHDFVKLSPDSFTYFYARGRPTGTYTYSMPRAKNDGWTVARARDVGMSEDKLAEMVRTIINSSIDSANAYRPHGILVARHGKLVLDEYFYGENEDKLHDTRSASKTLTTLVLGAAMEKGMKVGPNMPVFATMGMTSPDLDPRKRAMKLRDLLTMSSGLDCDDGAEEYHPGSEDNLTNQDTIPDWLSVVVGLKMLRDPGAKGVYCSINPYFAGEVIAKATGRSFPDLAWDLIGAPLQMGRYTITLDPLGRSYMGGGARFTLRDFAKWAQLYANGGMWNGRRILSRDWVRESIEPRYLMSTQIETPFVAKSELNYGICGGVRRTSIRGELFVLTTRRETVGSFLCSFPIWIWSSRCLGGTTQTAVG